MNILIIPHNLPSSKNMTKPILFALASLGPFPHSYTITGQRSVHVSVASRWLWRSPQSTGVAAMLQGLRPAAPRSQSCFVEHHLITWARQITCPAARRSSGKKSGTWGNRPLVQNQLLIAPWLPHSGCPEKNRTEGRNMGVHKEKKTRIFIFHCQLGKTIFSTVCMSLFFSF